MRKKKGVEEGKDESVTNGQEQAATETQTVKDAQAAIEEGSVADQLSIELRQTKDQLLRQVAEFQNYRRRTEKEWATVQQRGQSQVIQPMLDVFDDFRRSLEASAQVEQQETPGPAYQALKQGIDLVYQKFSDELKKLGVEQIEAIGHPFDEHWHEALMQMPAPEGTEPGTVLDEIQRGYRQGDRVLRHARVVVAA